MYKKLILIGFVFLSILLLGCLGDSVLLTVTGGGTTNITVIPENSIFAFYNITECPTGWIPADGTNNTPDMDNESYETGWINRSDWTNVHLGSNTTKNVDSYVNHSLDLPLSELDVKVFASTDASDVNSFHITDAGQYRDASGNTQGLRFKQIDNNNIEIQTGAQGVSYLSDAGQAQTIDTEDWYYKIIVTRKESFADRNGSLTYCMRTNDTLESIDLSNVTFSPVPKGTVIMFHGETCPGGYKLSNGSDETIDLNNESYDTGWINTNDWTNRELGSNGTPKNSDGFVNHSLNAPLSDLDVMIYISTDGTDNNAVRPTTATGAATRGITIYQVDENNIKVQTGTDGIIYQLDDGSNIVIDTEDWYYKVSVTRKLPFPNRNNSFIYCEKFAQSTERDDNFFELDDQTLKITNESYNFGIGQSEIRWNETRNLYEYYNGTQWVAFGFEGTFEGGIPKNGIVPFYNLDICPEGWISADGTNNTPDMDNESYDTGWINTNDWTNRHLGSNTTKNSDGLVNHSMNSPISELVVELFVSTDGTDATSFGPLEGVGAGEYGFAINQEDENNFKLQTGAGGIIYKNDAGQNPILTTQDWYYKIIVTRKRPVPDKNGSLLYCMKSDELINIDLSNLSLASVPIGTILAYGNYTYTPSGFLQCNGSEVRRDIYYELFNVIGTNYGDGDGSTTFNLPNLTEPDTYDTGWINRSDWTNVHMGSNTTKNVDSYVNHSLNAPLSELDVKLFVSSDGTDANSFETFNSEEASAANARGISIYQMDENNVKVQTGTNGLLYVADSGGTTPITTQDWYYKIVVKRKEGSLGLKNETNFIIRYARTDDTTNLWKLNPHGITPNGDYDLDMNLGNIYNVSNMSAQQIITLSPFTIFASDLSKILAVFNDNILGGIQFFAPLFIFDDGNFSTRVGVFNRDYGSGAIATLFANNGDGTTFVSMTGRNFTGPFGEFPSHVRDGVSIFGSSEANEMAIGPDRNMTLFFTTNLSDPKIRGWIETDNNIVVRKGFCIKDFAGNLTNETLQNDSNCITGFNNFNTTYRVVLSKNSNQSITNGGLHNNITWDNIKYDEGNMFDENNNETPTIKRSGFYVINYKVKIESQDKTQMDAHLKINGVVEPLGCDTAVGSKESSYVSLKVTMPALYYEEGDNISLALSHDDIGGTLTLSGTNTFIEIFEIK